MQTGRRPTQIFLWYAIVAYPEAARWDDALKDDIFMMKPETTRTLESAFVGINATAFLLPRVNRHAKMKTGIAAARSK